MPTRKALSQNLSGRRKVYSVLMVPLGSEVTLNNRAVVCSVSVSVRNPWVSIRKLRVSNQD
jgi:hypothetical protein